MRGIRKFAFAFCVLSLGLYASAGESSLWQSPQDEHPREMRQRPDNKKKDGKADEKKKGKEAKKDDYAELMKKSGKEMKGLFNVRHIEDKWYFDIPDSMLGRYILCVTRFTAVPQDFGKFSGEEVNENTIYFEKRDAKTMLMRAFVNTQQAPEDSRIDQTLKASTANPIVASFKIVQNKKRKDWSLVDVTNFFQRDNDVISLPNRASKMYSLGGLQSDRTFVDTMKVFPINIEVGTTRTYAVAPASPQPSAGGRPMIRRRSPASTTGSVTIGLNTSMVLLPKEPMRKRLWDERVGYFTTRVTYFNDDQHKTDREQIVARYRLVPKDLKKYQKGELVEPVKQIVYYIDPATPKKWVPYLIQGINDWNVAFEAAGFKDAIVAKEWPNDKNMSVDDARYCVLRYLPAEIENAYGPHIVDPRSGEIIESHICWYHNVMNLLTKWYMTQCGPLDPKARTMKFDDELMGQLIRFVSSHEVGHTLGLRHNMGSSHGTPVEKLRDKAWLKTHGHTASIMDYARFNYVAQPEDGLSEQELFPHIGEYDKWAIKWGYQYRPEFNDEHEEKEALLSETTKVLKANKRLWFGGEGYNEDPRAQTEDLGDDNVKASDYGVKNLKRVIANIPKWCYQKDDQFDDQKEMYTSVRDQFRRYTNHVLKNIGGRYVNNMPGEKPFEVAPAAKQRAAVNWLGRQLFEAPLWLYPGNLTELSGLNAATTIAAEQQRVLGTMLGAALLSKIYDNSFASPAAYQLPDYLNDVFSVVWKPLPATNGVSANTRRQLERAYVASLNKILNPSDADLKGSAARSFSSDAVLYALENLNRVEAFCKSQSASATGINKLHYQDLLRQIKRVNDRMTKVN